MTTMKPAGRLDDLSTREWLREALEVSPDAFALHHVIRDESGCFKELETSTSAELQAFSSRVLDTIGDSAAVIDVQDRIRVTNSSFLRLFGLNAREAVGRTLFDLGLGAGNEQRFDDYLRRGGGEPHEAVRLDHHCPKTGRHEFIHDAWPIQNTALRLFVTRDAGVPTRTQDPVDFRAEFLASSEAILVVDNDGVVVFANAGAAKLFGYTQAELQGLAAELLVPEGRRATHRERRALFAGEAPPRAVAQGDFIARRKDGTELKIAHTLHHLQHAGKDLVLCLVSDLERRRQADARILLYQEKLRRMTFDAAVAAEQERRRIAIELHDRIGQALAIARMKLDTVAAAFPEDARAAIAEIKSLVVQSAEDTRTLSFELSPPVLYDLGLGAGLSWLAEDLQRRYHFEVTLTDEASPVRIPEVTAGVLFRTARELLMNTIKHAKTGRARVSLRVVEQVLHLEASDEGAGFHPHPAAQSIEGGFGLFSVREQLARIGAVLAIQSAPGQGSKIVVSTPLGPQQRDERPSPAPRSAAAST